MSVRITMTQKSGEATIHIDQQLGVKGGISEGVVRIVVKLSAQSGRARCIRGSSRCSSQRGRDSPRQLDNAVGQPLPTMKETLESAACVVWTDLWRMFVLKGGRRYK